MEECQLKMKIITERIISLRVFINFLISRTVMLKVRIHLTKLDLCTETSLDMLRVRAKTFTLETQKLGSKKAQRANSDLEIKVQLY